MNREPQTKEEFYEVLKDMFVMCGKIAELPDKLFQGGCGEPVNIMKAYACVDCSASFHRKCLLKHIQYDMPVESLSKMPLEEAFKRIDELNLLPSNTPTEKKI